MTVSEAHAEVLEGWNRSYSPEAIAHAVESLDYKPLGYRINIFVARLCFRGIYFPQLRPWAWVKVIAQNRRTIFRLVKEAITGRGGSPVRPPARTSAHDPATGGIEIRQRNTPQSTSTD
jgi:hypothetical protein